MCKAAVSMDNVQQHPEHASSQKMHIAKEVQQILDHVSQEQRRLVAATIYRWCMTHVTCIAAPDSSVPGSITHPTVYAPREPMEQLSILSRIMVAPAEAFMASAIMSGFFSCHLAIRRQAVVHTSDSQVNMQRQWSTKNQQERVCDLRLTARRWSRGLTVQRAAYPSVGMLRTTSALICHSLP